MGARARLGFAAACCTTCIAYDANAEAAAPAKPRRIVLDTVRVYAREHGITTTGAPLHVKVLLAPNWKILGVAHGVAPAGRTFLPPDSVVAAFAGTKDTAVLRSANSNPLPQLQSLPPGSIIAWVQLAPPRVIGAEPKKP